MTRMASRIAFQTGLCLCLAASWGVALTCAADLPPGAAVWPLTPPADCPFPKSDLFGGVAFTGRHAEYEKSDTWYPSWAGDDRLYSPWTDGTAEGKTSYSGCTAGNYSTTGYAVIEGDDPLKLRIARVGLIRHEPFPYGGQYPCGTLVHNGVWYYGTYALDTRLRNPQVVWDNMGPFVGFDVSTDGGRTWTQPRSTANPLFGETAKDGRPLQMWKRQQEYDNSPHAKGHPGAKVKIGKPHFVDFGKNMEHSPDGKAYLLAQGQTCHEPVPCYAASDQAYLIRVRPSVETINDPKAYEFFAGRDAEGKPVWSGDFTMIQPLFEWNDHMGNISATYVPGLKRYLLAITDCRGPNQDNKGAYDTYILESKEITGPWKLASYLKAFGQQAYFINFPSKFISADGKTLWMCSSANWNRTTKPNPPGFRYALCLHEMILLPAK